MLQSTLIISTLSLFVGAGVLAAFIRAVKGGEYDDIERPKHRMLNDNPTNHRAEGAGVWFQLVLPSGAVDDLWRYRRHAGLDRRCGCVYGRV